MNRLQSTLNFPAYLCAMLVLFFTSCTPVGELPLITGDAEDEIQELAENHFTFMGNFSKDAEAYPIPAHEALSADKFLSKLDSVQSEHGQYVRHSRLRSTSTTKRERSVLFFTEVNKYLELLYHVHYESGEILNEEFIFIEDEDSEDRYKLIQHRIIPEEEMP